MSDLPDDLLHPQAYPHPVSKVKLIETHLSWVFLTGTFAYKVKKPVRFEFVDFSTLDRRKRFCDEELRCNRRFAGELYVDVCPIVQTLQGKFRVANPDDSQSAEDWAVRMRQFDHTQQADLLLEAGHLAAEELEAFGRLLAQQHQTLPKHLGHYEPLQPMLANFEVLRSTNNPVADPARLERLKTAATNEYDRRAALLGQRQHDGFVRECHGDLHLANIVRLDSGLCAFDCLEFSEDLRRIDVMSDVAFLFMDCLIRDRRDLAYSFLDGYLDRSGDYQGTVLLPLFTAYRSMVRAKVAALRLRQAPDDAVAASQLRKYLDWGEPSNQALGTLIVMNGVSGTGKSYWARQLAREFGAIRIRSDVLRKAVNAAPSSSHGSRVKTGRYAESVSTRLYDQMADIATDLLNSGQLVIIDAASLQRDQRQRLYAAAARAGAACCVIRLDASLPVLEQRLLAREQLGDDPSEADQSVLNWQLENQDVPGLEEPVVTLLTDDLTLSELMQCVKVALPDAAIT
ncbi:MAG: AAA family ATPase [Pseudomonadales bacterium]